MLSFLCLLSSLLNCAVVETYPYGFRAFSRHRSRRRLQTPDIAVPLLIPFRQIIDYILTMTRAKPYHSPESVSCPFVSLVVQGDGLTLKAPDVVGRSDIDNHAQARSTTPPARQPHCTLLRFLSFLPIP